MKGAKLKKIQVFFLSFSYDFILPFFIDPLYVTKVSISFNVVL